MTNYYNVTQPFANEIEKEYMDYGADQEDFGYIPQCPMIQPMSGLQYFSGMMDTIKENKFIALGGLGIAAILGYVVYKKKYSK